MDYNIYTNAQVSNAEALNQIPLKTEGQKSVFLSDVGNAVDGSSQQYNIVRVNGQKSVYAPILKQGGDTNTIVVVNGIKKAITMLRDIPAQLHAHVVFDQSVFVKQAISTVLREGGIGLLLTAVMILLFLGSMRATAAVFLSIPLSVMITFFILHSAGKTINSMVLSGLALAFSRLIDDSVVVIENIYRHIELGEDPKVAAVKGTNEVALAVLAIMLVAVVVFFPVTLLFGVSKYLFSALALAVVLALFASYFDAVTVVPLFCAYFLKPAHTHGAGAAQGAPVKKSWGCQVSRRVQRQVRKDAERLRKICAENLGSSTRSAVRLHWHLPAEFCPAAIHRRFFFPAVGRRPVRHQCESPHRHAHRSHQRLRKAS